MEKDERNIREKKNTYKIQDKNEKKRLKGYGKIIVKKGKKKKKKKKKKDK